VFVGNDGMKQSTGFTAFPNILRFVIFAANRETAVTQFPHLRYAFVDLTKCGKPKGDLRNTSPDLLRDDKPKDIGERSETSALFHTIVPNKHPTPPQKQSTGVN